MNRFWMRGGLTLLAAAAIVAVVSAGFGRARRRVPPETRTPIEYVVVIFQENQSFDHYFATYPHSENLPGEPPFHASAGTPAVNGLTPDLIAHNPNLERPWRMSRRQAAELIPYCDNDHGYTAEQKAYDGGRSDKFVQFTGPRSPRCPRNFVMGYLDGNTVTALWNYAQHFSLEDNFFNTTYGPSMLGAINLVSGQTSGAEPANVPGIVRNGTMVGNPPAAFDDCVEEEGIRIRFSGKNIGDLLNAHELTWGWFSAGSTPTGTGADGAAVCGLKHIAANGEPILAYDDPDPFDYFESTANPHHKPPSSIEAIGRTDQGNHQYDLDAFWTAARSGHLPAVSFVRGWQDTDGHPGYSGPLPEQQFLVELINRLQQLPEWKSMAVFLTWDDSDGWYDHVMPPNVNSSQIPGIDALFGADLCGHQSPLSNIQGRCGYGPRLPLLIISPFAKVNFVDHDLSDQTSMIRFIEDNWNLGRIGGGSLDERAGSLMNAFDFANPHPAPFILDSNSGEVK